MISIIIPHYGHKELLFECINSITEQDYDNYEIVVVDNNSNIIDNINHLYNNKKLTYIPLKRNFGYSYAVNIGVNNSSGDVIFLLNNDTTLQDNCLSTINSTLHKNQEFKCFALKVLNYYKPTVIDSAGLSYNKSGYGNRTNRVELLLADKPAEVFCPCGSAAVYRKEVFKNIGYFNEKYFMYFEDLEFGFRSQLYGYKCLYLPQVIVYHKISSSSKTYFNMKVQEIVKNSIYTLLTCMPKSILLKNIFRIIIFYLKFWSIIIFKGYHLPLLKAIYYIISHFDTIATDRFRIQRKINCNLKYLENILSKGKVIINFPNQIVKL